MLLTGSPALNGELPGPLGGVDGVAPGGATHVELRGGWLGGGSGAIDAPDF